MPIATREDRALVSRCLAREAGAWEALLARQGPEAAAAIRAVAARWGMRLAPEDADDILQETFAALWRDDMKALRTFRGECALSTYVRTVAASALVRWRRRQAASPRPLAALPPEDPGAGPPTPLPVEREEDREALRQAVDRLPPRERRAILARYWNGATAAEIGRLLNLDPAHVRVILSRARERLATALKKSGF